MKFLKVVTQILFYTFIVFSLVCVAVIAKIVATLISDNLIYKTIIIGDFFAILDIGEFINIIVFAVLGLGFGLASFWLPNSAQIKTSVILLILLVPLIFSTSAFVRYNSWVEEFATREKISYAQAEAITNSFLQNRVKIDGFLGFYWYSGQFPMLPTNKKEIRTIAIIEQKVKSQFFSLSKLTKLSQEVISGILATAIWAIRFFYFSLSAFTTISHFHLGCQIIDKRRQPPNYKFPPVPPNFNPAAAKASTQGLRRRVRNS